MSLARRYRPVKFSELVGQDIIARALLQTLQASKPPQAFLFSGIRGTGKTSLARLYAAALNCTHSDGFERCTGCSSCPSASAGTHEDILEIDGASHNSVEDVRRIQETLLYRPQRSRRKVYLIDEVHMLSLQAFNALLKTLEEPPEHVVFLFATTELAKLPATVVGRCQTFHLRRLPRSLISERMKEILAKENISYDDGALELLASHGEGSLRDALTLLDQAVALGENKAVRSGHVEQLLDYVPWQQFLPLITEILACNGARILSLLADFWQQGTEPRVVAERLVVTTRHLMVVLTLGGRASAPEIKKLALSPEQIAALAKICSSASSFIRDHSLHQLFRLLSSTFKSLDGSSVDRYILENALLEWASSHPSKDQNTANVALHNSANKNSPHDAPIIKKKI